MRPISSTELPPLSFQKESEAQEINAPTAKIGWIHSLSDQPGASFDVVIKDALGRTKFEKKNCTADTKAFGELVNLPTFIGEKLSISVGNIRGAEKIDLFLN